MKFEVSKYNMHTTLTLSRTINKFANYYFLLLFNFCNLEWLEMIIASIVRFCLYFDCLPNVIKGFHCFQYMKTWWAKTTQAKSQHKVS